MKAVLFVLAFAAVSTPAHGDLPGGISGTVRDAATLSPIVGATVMLAGTGTGTMTDASGSYRIEDVPAGSYSVAASCVGYSPLAVTDAIVRPDRITDVDFDLRVSASGNTTITVMPDYFPEASSSSSGLSSLSGEQVRRAPGSAGDVVRVITSLPSVVKFDDQYNGLAVRGGNPSETGFYIDGIEMANINHFPRQGTTGGGLGMVNVDLLENVTFMAGGFPSRYGGRLSSVMELSLREGAREGFEGQLDFSMSGIGGIAEGSLDGGRGSWLACARHSWIDLLVDIADIPTVASYSDFAAKVVYDLSPGNTLSFVSAGAVDHSDYTRDQAWDDGNPDYGVTDSWNATAGGSLRMLWGGGNGYTTTSLSVQGINYGGDYGRTSTGSKLAQQNSVERSLRLMSASTWLAGGGVSIGFGAEGEYSFDTFDNWFAPDTSFTGEPLPGLDLETEMEEMDCGLFAEVSVPLLPGLTATAGSRMDRSGDGCDLSPRGSLRCGITDRTAVMASGGVYRQDLPSDLVARGGVFAELEAPSAVHCVLGFSHLIQDETRLTVELYDKEYSDLPYDPTQPGFAILDGLGSEQNLYSFDTLATGGEARSLGVELLVEKKLVSGVYGILAGSWSAARYRNPGEPWRDRIYDNRFTFTAEGGYKPSRSWEFSARWVYAGGRPYTPLDLEASALYNRTILDEGRINAERLPAFHSLNIRADRRFAFEGSNLVAYASLWNVYARRNIATVFWNEVEHCRDEILQWGLMPVLGLEYEF